MKRYFVILLSLCILICSVTTELSVIGLTDGNTFPINFENGDNLFPRVDNVYSGAVHWTSNGISLVTGSDALNGTNSVKVSDILAGNSRTELDIAKMAGISGFSKTDFSSVTGMMIRVKIANDTTNLSHTFSIALRQTGIAKATWLGNGAVAYDVDGKVVNVTSSSLGMKLPAGFNGFLFLPFSSANSEQVTKPGYYDNYSTYPNSMVDLSKDFSMQILLNDSSWSGTSITMDDLSIYSGDTMYDHITAARKCGYVINTVIQPNRYTYPLTFDDSLMPFNQVDNVYDNAVHWTNDGVSLVTDAEALNGTKSAKVVNIRSGNIRTELNEVKMNGITGFSKSDFTTVTGLMMRIKIDNDSSNSNHPFSIALRQTGVSKVTWLGSGAAAYDANGNIVDVSSTPLSVNLPSGFDGFVFMPFSGASSEQVTVPGQYDKYNTYPDSMVDLSKDYTMQVYFNDSSWSATSVTMDDMRVYSGDTMYDHMAAARDSGYVISAVIQPARYSFPLKFDDLYMPFTQVDNVYDGAVHWTKDGVSLVEGEEALNGTNSVKVSDISSGNDRTELSEVKMTGITGFSKSVFSSVTGIMMRVKIDNDSSNSEHQFSIALRQPGVSKVTWLGSSAAVYDTDGNIIRAASTPLSIKLPSGFDGFVFMPFSDASSEQVTVPGQYDKYNTYPDSMVDLSKDYTMQVYFNDSSWNGTTVRFDDLVVYSGSEHKDHLNAAKNCGYNVTAVAQPSRYSFPLTFEDLLMPFNQVDNVYDSATHWSNSGVGFATGAEAINGNCSVKIANINSGNSRTELNEAKMTGISGFSMTDFSSVTGLMLRVKINNDSTNSTHAFSIALRQDGVSKATWLGSGALVYDADGNGVNVSNGGLSVMLPAGFDGFVFLPFNSACSEQVTETGFYDKYSTHPESMVDLSKDYTMQVYFGDSSWSGTTVVFDDLYVYSGSEHQDHLNAARNCGYNVTATAQPSRYSFPLVFDDGIMPFKSVDDVYSDAIHWRNDGVGLVGGDSALCGSKSVQVSSIRSGNSRTELNEVKMAAIPDFSKSDFSQVSGIMLRVNISGSSSSSNHMFSIALRQTGVKRATWLGFNASAYDINGNKLQLQQKQLGISLPDNFNGYLFIPFDSAKSEQVTETGFYDSYNTYPDSMVDLSKDYTMQVYFGDSTWGGATVTLDDMRIYSGNKHVTFLQSLYSGITAVQQPDYYNFPIDFDGGMVPFTSTMDGGKYAQNGVYGTGGTISYTKSEALHNGTAMKVDFAKDLTDAYSVYTSKAKVKGDALSKGILVRLKTNSKESATFSIMTDWLTDKCTIFGSGALLFDINGNQLDHPRASLYWLGCNLPADFDGFVFIPFGNGFVEKQKSMAGNIPGWTFEAERDLQFIFYGESQWQGSSAIIDYVGLYDSTNYLETIEKAGYKLNYQSAVQSREILGDAASKFFYTTVLNESFDEASTDALKKWSITNEADKHSLSGHYTDNVSLSNGSLVLKYNNESKGSQKYTAGAIRTADKYSYGYYEASVSIPQLAGTESVFRLVTDGHYTSGGTGFEVDIAYLNDLYKLTTDYRSMKDYKSADQGGTPLLAPESLDSNEKYAGVFHTYGLLYTYNYLRFYVDGVLVRTVENTFAHGGVFIEFAQNVTKDLTENLTSSNSEMRVDYARYWSIDVDEMMSYDTIDGQKTATASDGNTVTEVAQENNETGIAGAIKKVVEVLESLNGVGKAIVIFTLVLGLADVAGLVVILIMKKRKHLKLFEHAEREIL